MEEFDEIVEEIEELVKTINQEEIQEKTTEAGVEVEEGRKRKSGDEGKMYRETEMKLTIFYLIKNLN